MLSLVTSMAQYRHRLPPQLFSHPEMVRDLLLGCIATTEWVAEAERHCPWSVNGSLPQSLIANGSASDDMVWRVKVGPHWLWVYLPLEFQSEPDRWMSVRMLVYLGLLASISSGKTS